MNKKVLIGISAFLVLAVASFAYVRSKPDMLAPSRNITNRPSNPQPTTEQPVRGVNAGVYTEYQPGATLTSSNQKVLFFYAPWCPQCRSIEAGIKDQGVPDGYTILKVDYDSNQELRKKYGVTLQTTFVKIDDNGNLISKYVAYDEPTFDAVKKNYL